MKPLICKVSLTDLPVNLFNEWWGPYMVWNHDTLFLSLSVSKFAHFQMEKKMNRHAWRNLGICKSFANHHFRQVWQNIHSVKKKKGGGLDKKNPWNLSFWGKWWRSHLMADKCSLPVTRTDKQSVSLSCPGCRTEKRRIPKVTITFISLNQHTEPPAAGTCRAVVPERWARSGEAAASCLPVQANHNSITN